MSISLIVLLAYLLTLAISKDVMRENDYIAPFGLWKLVPFRVGGKLIGTRVYQCDWVKFK